MKPEDFKAPRDAREQAVIDYKHPTEFVCLGILEVDAGDGDKGKSVRPLEIVAYLCPRCSDVHVNAKTADGMVELFYQMTTATAELLAEQLINPRTLPTG